jgi:hypothetical protein
VGSVRGVGSACLSFTLYPLPFTPLPYNLKPKT